MQRTRCYYFRDTGTACNKRKPGEGCTALGGVNRIHAVVGGSDHCICTHPSDLAVALVSMDAIVHTRGGGGERRIPLTHFYTLPGSTPQIETVLRHGELITGVELPPSPLAATSYYRKVRDRASYEFALVSVAAGMQVRNGKIAAARLAFGGIAPVPWRSHDGEAALIGRSVTRESFRHAAEIALHGAVGRAQNTFKIELAKRTAVRALSTVGGNRMSAPLVGSPVDRVDGRLKVTGAAKYSAEWPMRGMLYAVMVTSTVAKGRIVAIDTATPERLPGVRRVYTHRNAPKLNVGKANPNDRILPALQDDFIRYDRQPIALVVADSIEHATDAAQRITGRYESSADVRLFNHYTPAQQQAPEVNQAPADLRKGDAQSALASSAVRVDAVYTTPTEHHNPMEPHATTAAWDGDHLTLYDATQGVFSTRNRVAYVLGVPAGNVHVITKFVGGGFGSKGSAWAHTVLAAMAARDLGHPVKLVLTRPQMFSSVGNRPPTSQRVAIGASADGKIQSLIHETTSATSTFDTFVESSSMISRVLYDAPNITSTHHLVRVDVPTPTYMRAPGESSGSFALESAMDELASKLGIDPLELRLRNYAEVDPEKGLPFSSKSLRECYRAGAERFGWSRRNPAPRSMRDGRLLVGMGMASATYPAHRSRASANARLMSDGSALVTAGSQDIGTGAYTVFTQLSAESLGLPIARVRFDLGDTAMPMTPVSGGSQTTASVGSAVKAACDAVIQKLVDLAVADASSPLHGMANAEITRGDGRIFATASPARGETYAAILGRQGMTQLDASADAMPGSEQKEYAMHAFGAQFAEVRVDPELGEIRLARMVGAFASGRILNEKTARSQYLGGIVYGVGMGLLEETHHDVRLGRVMTANLADYLVPVHADIPTLDVILVPESDPHVNPIGVKGIGEIGIVGVAAAIANAVYHATGKRVRELPLTAEKILS